MQINFTNTIVYVQLTPRGEEVLEQYATKLREKIAAQVVARIMEMMRLASHPDWLSVSLANLMSIFGSCSTSEQASLFVGKGIHTVDPFSK